MPLKEEFKVLPLKFSQESSSPHDIYFKEHPIHQCDAVKPAGRTLLVLNIPPYVTGDNLKKAFSAAGKAQSVLFKTSPSETIENGAAGGFKVAYVVFKSHESLAKALKLTNLKPLSTHEEPVPTGLRKWVLEYNASIYDHTRLAEEAQAHIKQFDKQQEEEKAKGKNEADDEGWTVVTKKTRNPGLSRKESVENKITKKNSLKARKKELRNFYKFQMQEEKMKHVTEMRQQLEENKNKIDIMKKLRNFRPY